MREQFLDVDSVNLSECIEVEDGRDIILPFNGGKAPGEDDQPLVPMTCGEVHTGFVNLTQTQPQLFSQGTQLSTPTRHDVRQKCLGTARTQPKSLFERNGPRGPEARVTIKQS